MTRPSGIVVAVSGDTLLPDLLDALLVDRNDYEVIFVESVGRGYSRIKELRPDMIVVFMDLNDGPACGLLSMLTFDRDVSGIPVVMCVTRPSNAIFEPVFGDLNVPLPEELWM
jgi:hypothetical protein